MDLLPPGLVVARYYAAERNELDLLLGDAEASARDLEEFVEKHTGEDGLLASATTDAGKVTQAKVRARLKELADDPEGRKECGVLEVCLILTKSLAVAKRTAKAAQMKLDAKVLKRYANLNEAEIAELVVDDKWMASVEGAIRREVDRLTGGLVDRVGVLEGRYEKALPELKRQVEDYGAKVEGHLKRMGAVGMSRQFDFERLVELCQRTHEETRHTAARAIDRSLVVRNWLFGMVHR